MLSLDHIVFACADLAEGTAWLTAELGVAPVGGGEHPLMSTHNSLWRLGPVYMEMIAVNPAADAPGRPRWFGFDLPKVRARLSAGPQLHHWVARTEDMATTRAAASLDPGPVLRVTRDSLHWHLTVQPDGGLHHNGAYPTVISWPGNVTPPNETLPDQGIGLAAFELFGPPPFLEDLRRIGAAAVGVQTQADVPGLAVTLTRPDGGRRRFQR